MYLRKYTVLWKADEGWHATNEFFFTQKGAKRFGSAFGSALSAADYGPQDHTVCVVARSSAESMLTLLNG